MTIGDRWEISIRTPSCCWLRDAPGNLSHQADGLKWSNTNLAAVDLLR